MCAEMNIDINTDVDTMTPSTQTDIVTNGKAATVLKLF